MTYISIKQILDDLLNDDDFKGLSLERAVNYAIDFIRIIGIPQTFEEKECDITIKNYRGVIPDDCIEVINVSKKGCPSYVYSLGIGNPEYLCTYKVKGNVIFVSEEDDTLHVTYTAMSLDEEGFPTIVDNGTFKRALEAYITKEWFDKKFRRGELNVSIINRIDQQYAWAVAAAESDLIRPTIDQLESIKNMWTSMIQKTHKHNNKFQTLHTPNNIK